MKTETVPLSRIRTNAANPRTITDAKFRKLTDSILALPKMLEIRPVVTDDTMTALGGNMRLRALTAIAGMSGEEIRTRLSRIRDFRKKTRTEQDSLADFWLRWKDSPAAPVIRASELTDAERREFVIADNAPAGGWDYDMLANEWNPEDLADWGVDVWQPEFKELSPAGTDRAGDDAGGTAFGDPSLAPDDLLYDSDNEFDIPSLRSDRQPENGLALPFSAWGADTRLKKGVGTYHFYVEDYRFEAIWKRPGIVPESGCKAVVEPNLSLFDTTPAAYGLHLIYKKRWIARFWQECGVKVYADLNVAQKFYRYNRMGVPDGYNAFATRGYADREEYLKMEIQTAREISGLDKPDMIVCGGGKRIKELCMQNGVLYAEQFMANKNIKKRR